MATQEQIEAIAGLYVAYFDRAPDPAGLNFWINQLDNGRDFTTISQDFATSLEAQDIYPFLANPELATTSPAAFVTSIYANLFGRAPEQAGLDFWVAQINDGKVLPGDMVEAVMLGARNAVINGEFVQDKTTIENKIECALEFTNSVMTIEGYVFDNAAYEAARQAVDGIDASPESVAEAKLFIEGYVGSFLPVEVFTACLHEVEISPAVVGELVTSTEIYWGYNPHAHGLLDGFDNLDGNDPNGNDNNLTNEGPQDGGISAEAFFFGTDGNPSYLSAIAGTDFFEMAIFDVDDEDFPVPDFSSLRDITVTAGDAGTGGTVTFHYSDGSADDIAIGTEYFAFLNDLIFDEEGNTRFFEKEVAAQIPVYLDANGVPTTDPTQVPAGNQPIGYVDAFLGAQDAVTAHLPMILTTNVNNGGTYERGFTTDENDLIQVGQLQLLHGAIIDAGGGYNTLEVDAKGHFAQPKALQNIQQITVTALPNIYTDGDDPQGTEYPNLSDGTGPEDSILDLTRATDLENLTIAEGDYDGSVLDGTFTDGDLVVTGMRNDATLTLQGAFENGVTVRAGPGITGDGFTVHLQNVNFDDDSGGLDIAQNSPKLNLVSEGGANHIADLDADGEGNVRELVITGEAHLFIQSDLSAITEEDTPVTIDASGNEGGVDLNISSVEQVTFLGSTMDDRFAVDTANSDATDQGIDFNNDQSVVINNALGDNYYDIETYALELNDGDGDGNVELLIVQGEITLGDGDNHVEGQAVNLVASAGDGDNKFDIRAFDSPQTGPFIAEDDFPTLVDLTAGDGSNIFNVFVDADPAQASHFLTAAHVNITAGDGGNLIQVPALPFDLDGYDGEVPPGVLNFLEGASGDVLSTVEVNTGSGDDTILVGGSTITVHSGGGDDTITLLGIDNDYVTEVASLDGSNGGTGVDYGYSFPDPEDGNFNYKGFIPSVFGATLDIDTGSGSATINLGAFFDDAFGVSGALVAKEGSVITGQDITLFVNTHADLRAADLSGITSIVLDDDKYGYGGQGFPAGSSEVGESASLTLLDTQFVALGQDVFSTQGETFGAQSTLTIIITSDTTLSQLIDFSSWNDSVKLCFVVEDGATLTLSAEELHKYVAPEGIAVDESNAYIDNQVVVTDAGFLFDPFNDQFGGSGGGTIAGSLSNQDIDIIYTPDGYERPSQDPSTATINIDSDVTPVVENVISPFANKVVIEGNADLEITGRIDLADNFEIDFSDFAGDFIPENAEGTEIAFTIYNFQELTAASDPYDWGRIDGNGTSADPVRVNIVMQNETTVGDEAFGVDKGGIHTSGVQEFIFTGFVDSNGYDLSQSFDGEATIVVCDKTEDLEVLGLQNSRNAEITFKQVNWGTEILMEGDGYANSSDQEKNLGDPDLSEVGAVNVNFFESGANAFVRVTNQGTELGLNEDAEDGFDPDGERVLDVAGIAVSNADRLLIQVEDGDAVINDVSGLDVERVIVTGPEDVKIYINGVADEDLGSPMAMPGQGLDSADLVSIDGSGVAGEFSIALTADADLSGVDLTGVDSIMLIGPDMGELCLTLTAQQVIDFGGLIMSMGGTTELAVVEYNGEGIDFSAIDVDNIKSITTSDVDGDIIVDPAADFGDADVFTITAEDTDTNVQMTAAQFGTITDGTVMMDEAGGTDGSLSLTDVPADDEIVLTNVTADADGDMVADINLIGVDFVATEDFMITDGAGGNSGSHFITAILSGTSDVTEVPVANLLDLDCLLLQDGAVLTITAEQLEILYTIADELKIADGANVTINITDLSDEELDLDALVDDNPGLNIGTITILDNNLDIVIDEDTTFGGADEIITPTADVNDDFDGLEDTSITMTVAQFLTSAGIITGDGTVNLTELRNNNDSDGDFVLDEAVVDVSGISAPMGTVRLAEEGPLILLNGETVTLAEVTDLSGFEIILTDGQLIRFKTEEQADGATITEDVVGAPNPTGVVWLFTSVSGPIDTSNYSPDLNTLFVDEALVDGANEEDLWTFLAGSIVVEKFNDGAPNALVVVNRINTFEAFGAAPNGITFDDTGEFQTTGSLTLNLEGNVEIASVTIDDTNGEAAFQSLTINSYFDIENLPATIDPGIDDPTGDPSISGPEVIEGYIIQPNQVGDIFLNAAVAAGETVLVTLNTSDGQEDARIANGGTGLGSGFDLDAGMALEVGTIHLGTPAAGENSADINILGDNDVSIAGIDMSDPALTQVNVLVDGLLDADGDPVLEIGGIDMDQLSEEMSVTDFGIGDDTDLDQIVYIQDFTGDATTVFNADQEAGNDEIILNVAGDNDIKDVPVGPTFQVDGVYASTPGVLNLTAAQIEAIGIRDAFGGADGTADNWVLGPGVNPGDVTINICELTSTTGPLDLDAIQAAGFNIGTITLVDDGGPTVININNGTTLGGADQIVMELDFEDIDLIMTAEQFNSFSGVIVEDRSEDALTDPEIQGSVTIELLSDIEDDVTGEVTIDTSNVEVTGDNTFWIREFGDVNPPDAEDNDTTFSAASVLDPTNPAFSSFSVTLADLNSDAGIADELAGQTIRFSTEVQANGRVVTVVGADDDTAPASDDPDNIGIDESEKDEKDTNVVWLFDSVSGGLDVSGYNGNIGRLWVSDELVDSVGGDVDSLFTIPNPDNPASPLFTLDADIIKRIETEDLTALLQLNVGINQRVEITAFTTIAGAEFEIDDPLVSIQSLRIDMGGATDINDLEIDNILGPVDPENTNFPGDDDFNVLTINSLLANHEDHYLLPDSWTDAIPLPSNDVYNDSFENNVVGDISSGEDRGVLHTIVINTFDNDFTDTVPPADPVDDDESDVNGIDPFAEFGREGAQFVAETIYFSDDGDTTAVGGDTGTPGATLTITGENDVTVKSLDASDADITSLFVDLAAHTGTFTITGGSPAFDGDDVDDTTTSLTIDNGSAATGVVTLASSFVDNNDPETPGDLSDDDIVYTTGSGEPAPWAGVSGGALEEINTGNHGGTISLGVISQINGDDFTLDNSSNVGGAEANIGQVYACLGTALDDGVLETPTLNDGGTWLFNGSNPSGTDNLLDLEIKDVVLGAGTLEFEDTDVCITGDVDFSGLDALIIDGDSTIKIAAGGKLTLTVEQVDILEGLGVEITGEGTVCVIGESDDSDAATDTSFSNLQTATVDLSAVTLADDDISDAVEIVVSGAKNVDGTELTNEDGDFVPQTIIGTANNDTVTVLPTADDGDDEGIEVILRLGGDSGSIGDPLNTLTDGSPEEDALEEVGDVIIKGSAVEVQVEVDAGFDQINQLDGGASPADIADVVQVAAGAEFYAANVTTPAFTADENSTNEGTAVIENATGSVTVDVSDAGGANGWVLIGADEAPGPFFPNTLIGSDMADTLVDGTADTGNNNFEEDTFTGGAEADLFQFSVELSDIGEFEETTTTVGLDTEEIEILGPMAGPTGGALQFNMRIGPFAPAQILLVDGADGADLSSDTGIAAALAAALNARADVTATVTGAVVEAEGVNGGRLDLINVVEDPGGAPVVLTDGVDYNYDDRDDAGDYGNDPADTDNDDRAEMTLELSGSIAVGETYTVEVTRSDGSQFSATVLATTADPQDVIDDLADALETASGGDIGFVSAGGGTAPAAGDAPLINAVIPANTLVAFDNDADNGGFTISEASGTASISGAGSSSLIVGGETTVAEVDPDVITDFVSGEDTITFGLGAGTNSNYDEGAEVADFATALADANAAMDGTVIYYLTSSAAAGEEGLLFYDANGDGTADALVHLVGIDSTSFDEDDIV